MKIIVFSDVHGNIESLNLLSLTNDYKTSDMKIFLGDAVIIGESPNECCEFLINQNCGWLLGNHDSYIANGLPFEERQQYSIDKIEQYNYMKKKIKNKLKKYIKSLNKFLWLELNDKKFYFTHYVWESDENVIDNPSIPTQDNIAEIFKAVKADYIFYGHEHNPSVFNSEQTKYICVGSLGVNSKGYYCVINIDNNETKIEYKTININ